MSEIFHGRVVSHAPGQLAYTSVIAPNYTPRCGRSPDYSPNTDS